MTEQLKPNKPNEPRKTQMTRIDASFHAKLIKASQKYNMSIGEFIEKYMKSKGFK